jgi:hypothetical protein
MPLSERLGSLPAFISNHQPWATLRFQAVFTTAISDLIGYDTSFSLGQGVLDTPLL